MHKGRLEAFSDGVIAIIITIMVLELKVPEGRDLAALRPLIPVILSYVLSFIYLGIYWNNHHHLFQAAQHTSGSILWANLHLLFWLSLIPATTAWIGETEFATWPVALYGVVLWFSGLAYYILSRALIRLHGHDSLLANAVGRDNKGILSLILYTLAIPVAFVQPWLSCVIYIVVAVIWLIPDQRIERKME